MAFDAYDTSLELIRSLRQLIEQIALRDPDLARQLRRAASSVPQNLREGRRRAGKDRPHHFRIAAGSADEVVACLEVAQAWAYVAKADVAPALEQIPELVDVDVDVAVGVDLDCDGDVNLEATVDGGQTIFVNMATTPSSRRIPRS